MPKRVDDNQKQIVKALRKLGITVRHTHEIGRGFPDIAVGYRKKNYLFEIKDPSKPPSARTLTPDEYEFFKTWRGQWSLAENVDDILAVIGWKP